jgi:hypothetical protein
MFFFVVFAPLCLLSATRGASASARAYYASPTLGSDTAHAGTSPGSAWASLAASSERASAALLASGVSGVSLLLARDAVFLSDPLRLSSAAAAAEIRIGPYGNASLPRPLLQFARGLTDVAPCVHVQAPRATAVTVEHLHFR